MLSECAAYVQSCSYYTSGTGELDDVVKRWNDVPIFVVGKATAAAGRCTFMPPSLTNCFIISHFLLLYMYVSFLVIKLGLKSTGAASGNAELLAEQIIKCKVIIFGLL